MRTPLVVGNWKMNLTACEAEALSVTLSKELKGLSGVEVAVCPAFPFLTDVTRKLVGTNIEVGAQNVSWEEKGAFTGEVSVSMLESIVKFVIVGHSERRTKLGETDGMINWKMHALLKTHLVPILCVGENIDARKSQNYEEFIRTQLEIDLKALEPHQVEQCVIAYEPIWAIGTGMSATPQDAEEGCYFIRETIGSLYSAKVAATVRVLYGGSVNAQNATKLISGEGIDGFLVGGASIIPTEFVGICKAVQAANGTS